MVQGIGQKSESFRRVIHYEYGIATHGFSLSAAALPDAHVAFQVEVGNQRSQVAGESRGGGILLFNFAQFGLDAAHVSDAAELVERFEMLLRGVGHRR